MQVILDSSFARPGLAPIWGGKKVEFRDWTSDGVIQLVGLRSYDVHLSVTFLSDMQRTPKLYYNVCLLRCDSNGS